MRVIILSMVAAGILMLPAVIQGQSDSAKVFKTNCGLCHSADGSGDNPTGKALHAKDLRSDDVQKQNDAALTDIIAKGRGKMPAFGAKLKADDIGKLVAYIRSLAKK
jgi:mono/diheme cytochrome c family protein